MAKANPLRIRDHRTAVLVGLALTAAGGWTLYDAYEGRGHTRPFFMKFLGSGWA
jgi:hypothetical protein